MPTNQERLKQEFAEDIAQAVHAYHERGLSFDDICDVLLLQTEVSSVKVDPLEK